FLDLEFLGPLAGHTRRLQHLPLDVDRPLAVVVRVVRVRLAGVDGHDELHPRLTVGPEQRLTGVEVPLLDFLGVADNPPADLGADGRELRRLRRVEEEAHFSSLTPWDSLLPALPGRRRGFSCASCALRAFAASVACGVHAPVALARFQRSISSASDLARLIEPMREARASRA